MYFFQELSKNVDLKNIWQNIHEYLSKDFFQRTFKNIWIFDFTNIFPKIFFKGHLRIFEEYFFKDCQAIHFTKKNIFSRAFEHFLGEFISRTVRAIYIGVLKKYILSKDF